MIVRQLKIYDLEFEVNRKKNQDILVKKKELEEKLNDLCAASSGNIFERLKKNQHSELRAEKEVDKTFEIFQNF